MLILGTYIVSLFVSIAFTRALLPLVVKLCYMKKILDRPDSRKVHHNEIPRLGGVLFLPAVVLSLGIGAVCFRSVNHTFFSLLPIISGAVVLCVTGIIDDIRNLGAKTKFLLQGLSALFVSFSGNTILDLSFLPGLQEISYIINSIVTIFFVLVVINALNLIDGIDGLASSLAMIALVVYAGFFHVNDAPVLSFVCLSVIGTLGVFTYYNIRGSVERQTKTFMGDSGSMVIGYLLAFLGCGFQEYEVVEDYIASCYIVISPLIIPIFDMVRVAITRLAQGKGMFTADKQHIHHLCMAKGMSMHRTLLFILALQIAICLFNYVLISLNIHVAIIIIVDIIIYAFSILQQKV